MAEQKFRLVTRSDFDGLVCAVLLNELELIDEISFAPDRARPAWLAIPVATGAPIGIRYHLRLRLPQGGKGYAIEGEQGLSKTVAGYDLRRTVQLKDGVLDVEERTDATGVEIAADRLPDERDALATVQAMSPHVIGPAKPTYLWDYSPATIAAWPQSKAVEATFAKAIAADAEDATGYSSRSNFRWGIGDYKNALVDLDKAIGIKPDVDLYLQRAYRRFQTGDVTGALADGRMARQLDPASGAAVGTVAGPVGTLVGAAVGVVVGGLAGNHKPHRAQLM